MNSLSCKRLLVLGVVAVAVILPNLSHSAPEPSPLKFPESASSEPLAASASTTQGSRDATRVIEEIINAARSGRNVDVRVGNTDLNGLASDPELKKVLISGRSAGSAGDDVQGRNYVADKLCSLGLAKCGESRNRNYGGLQGGINGIRDVTLVQPVELKPVGHPIAAIPLNNRDQSPFAASNKNYDVPSSLYPSETQGGFIQSSRCACVPVNQCNSYDIVSGPNYNGGPSTSYPPHYPSSSGNGNYYPPQNNYNNNNNNYQSGNYNPNFITGTGRPSYGQVGHSIDPRNKLESQIESNATIVEADSSASEVINARSIPESSDSANATSSSRRRRDAPRVIDGGNRFNNGGGCYERGSVCCKNPQRPVDRNPSYQPGGSSYPSNNNYYNKPGNNNFNGNNNGGVCGKRNAYGINGRVLTGVQSNYGIGNGDTEFGEYPWQVALLRKDGGDNVFVCGGSLIDSRHVLTAAHCIQSHRPQTLRVRMGDWDVSGDSEFYPHQDLDVAAIALHPDYNSGNLFNDIAIVKLDGYVDLGRYPHISPICLPDKYYEFSGKRCIVTGWGKDAWGHEGKFQHRLKEVDLPVLNHYDCEQKLKRTKLGHNFVLHPGFMCAGGEPERDACKGDGGGPLACEVNGVWQLAGIISWGVGCGQPDVPGVYVRVSNYHDWIRKNVGF